MSDLHERLEALTARARREVDEGLLPNAQWALARDGAIIAGETLGEVPEQPLFAIFSATKALTSTAAWLLLEAGELDLERSVADYVPEFGSEGKDAVRVEQLFTHTAGFPSAPFRPTEWEDRDARLARFARWRLNWAPGSRFEYHATSSMYVIAELIERITGQDYRAFIAERIAAPLGLDDLHVGLPDGEHHRAVACAHVGDALTAEDYAAMGVPEPPVTEVTEEAITAFNLPEVRRAGIPGGGAFTSAASLALFYQALVNEGTAPDGTRIWQPATVAEGLRVRSGDLTDPVFGKRANRTLGLILAGDDDRTFRGFGHTHSERAFGHNGAGGQLAWADPATGLSFAWVTGGHDRNGIRQARRGVGISSRAAVCAD